METLERKPREKNTRKGLPVRCGFVCFNPQKIQEGKNSLKIKFLVRIFLGHHQTSGYPGQNFMQLAFSVVSDREWPGCPGIWVGSQIWKNSMHLAHRNRSDFCDLRLRLRCPLQAPETTPISETRESNAALRFKGAMESR